MLLCICKGGRFTVDAARLFHFIVALSPPSLSASLSPFPTLFLKKTTPAAGGPDRHEVTPLPTADGPDSGMATWERMHLWLIIGLYLLGHAPALRWQQAATNVRGRTCSGTALPHTLPSGGPRTACRRGGAPLALFGRVAAPAPSHGLVGGFKYAISLLVYSSWKRKLIIFIHLYAVYKLSQAAFTGDNARAVHRAVGGGGAAHNAREALHTYVGVVLRVAVALLRSLTSLATELVLFVPKVLTKLREGGPAPVADGLSRMQLTQQNTSQRPASGGSAAGASQSPALASASASASAAAAAAAAADYRTSELERLDKLDRAKQRATEDQAQRELDRTKREQDAALTRLQREKAEHEARLARARDNLARETRALTQARQQAAAFELQSRQAAAAAAAAAGGALGPAALPSAAPGATVAVSQTLTTPSELAARRRQEDAAVRGSALQEERKRIEAARAAEDEAKNKQRVDSLEAAKRRLEGEVQELMNEQRRLAAAAEAAERKKAEEEKLAEAAFKRRLEEAARLVRPYVAPM